MDPAQEAVLKKIAWRIVPLLTLAYVVNYLDRTNIGFAALTMNKELGFTATEFGIGAGVLFIGYTVFEVPSNLALYRFGARRWIAMAPAARYHCSIFSWMKSAMFFSFSLYSPVMRITGMPYASLTFGSRSR